MGRKQITIARIKIPIITPDMIFLFLPVKNLKNMIFPFKMPKFRLICKRIL